jgi:hypothetical protein
MYFVDQSGAGLTGQIIVYASPDTLQIPQFWSIGRAIQSQVTSLDLIQGVQPPNPPANTTRLWSDASGHLHLAQSTGTDYTVLDTNNYGSIITLGGDLYGAINAAHINVKYNNYIEFTYSNNSVQRVLQPVNNDNYIFTGNSGILYFWSDTPAVNLGNWNASTNLLTVGGALTAGGNVNTSGGFYTGAAMSAGWPIAGDINVRRGTGSTGYVFFADINHYIGFDGAYYRLITSPLLIDNAIYFFNTNNTWNSDGTNLISGTGGGIYLRANSGTYVQTVAGAYNAINANSIQFQAGTGPGSLVGVTTPAGGGVQSNSGGGDLILGGALSHLYFHPNLSVSLYQNYPNLDVLGFSTVRCAIFNIMGNTCGIQVGRGSNELQAQTHLYSTGSFYAVLDAQATSFTVHSSEKYKENLVAISDADCLSKLLTPGLDVYSFTSKLSTEAQKAHGNRPPDSSRPSLDRIGFTAEQMHKVVPEAVAYSTNDNSPDGISYSDLSALMWGAIRQLNARLDKAGIAA